ncbi:MAG: chitobiase/beta-hexosaminidase C-terminal domain-containing protein [Cytophagaceae bacterium]|nr:chitobiase/beta-hexosaminidase C-terminal domain-containing protein [Cytophagaceae bacterium]
MKRILSLLTLGLNVIGVLFFIFQEKVQSPDWLNYAGKFHPLILHLPIGFAVAIPLFFLVRSNIEKASSEIIFEYLLLILAFSAAVTTFSGFLLSFGGDYEITQLKYHKTTGLIVSVLSYMLYEFRKNITDNPKLSLWSGILVFGLMAVVGHLGGSITHGEDFLSFKSEKNTHNDTVFGKLVNPILQNKCKSCHNPQKAKGKLDVTSIESIKKGGKNGKLWVAADTTNSHILKRIALPEEDKKHMAPKGKPQLTKEEIEILKNWIKEGTNYTLKISQLTPNSFFFKWKSNLEAPEKVYDFKALSESDIEKLNTPFCTVEPIANGSPALMADFFVNSKFDLNTLKNLEKAKGQLVGINLAKMPVGDEVFDILAKFSNLEKVTLNQTNISGKGIEKLRNCKNLNHLALSNTKISLNELSKLLPLKSLKELYLWETKITSSEAQNLQKNGLLVYTGFVPNPSEKLRLNPPSLVNESLIINDQTEIKFKHSLPKVTLRYTIDGSQPDTLKAQEYKTPIRLSKYTKINVLATKEGWLASEAKNFTFYKSGIKAQKAELITQPDPQYQGKGGINLINSKLGDVTNFKDENWLGYRGKDFESIIYFEKSTKATGMTISYSEKPDSYIMPPEWVEVFYRQKGKSWILLKKVIPDPLKKMGSQAAKGIDLSMTGTEISEVKIVAHPVSKLPAWHPGKGDKGWFFIDEVFFY